MVARLRYAGAILLGKSNLPEFAAGIQCNSPLFGITNNPWDRQRTPGGSSGGEAAAMAAGLTALGLGSDIGGSIRLPAHFCGLFALKPTDHRVSNAGHIPPPPGAINPVRHMAANGPLARSVADLRLGLTVIAGSDPRDRDMASGAINRRAHPAFINVALRLERRFRWGAGFGRDARSAGPAGG